MVVRKQVASPKVVNKQLELERMKGVLFATTGTKSMLSAAATGTKPKLMGD